MDHKTEISFGTYDSELMQQEITIPEGFEATIDGDKIILKKIESEDERIRKELIDIVKKSPITFAFEDKGKVLAWLEKQEQKPYNKVEPKFKVGDWIVTSYGKVNQVIAVDEDGDGFTLDDDTYFSGSWKDGEHLWTIEDAKPGDVLAMSWSEDDNFWEKIIIFKKYHNKGVKGLYNMPCVEGYGNTFRNGKLINEEVPYYSKTWTDNLHPATKEQCELLFQKMHEAGYTFDFEKKEPKKLKFKVGDEVITKNEESLTITRIDEEGYWSEDLFICSFDDSDKWELVESAWSEEDMSKVQRICKYLNEAKKYYADITEVRECMDWLKSLKDRVQPQPKQE